MWYPGDTISVGIGQGYFLATPIQLAVATSIIANKGNKFYKIPNDEDIFVRYNYVKIDGNRKILIKPSSAMNQLYILFEDLKPVKKNKK